ncbi:MAG: ankyrin repeat domain-containing protein [Fibromonadales bacterium]|nr:ankyrin repeat domain-containing protein [Fibromonadales bacterium]
MSFADIFEAAQKGTVEDVRYFIEQQGVKVDIKNDDGQTPLCLAMFNENNENSLKIAAFLIKAGADVDARGINGYSILHAAAMSGYAEFIKFLISKGADVKAENVGGETSLHCADSVEAAKYLIDAGADFNAKDKYGQTPLHTMINGLGRRNGAKVFKYLYEAGADVDAKDNNGHTLLHVTAEWSGNIEIAEYLISKNAKIDAKDNNDSTPLHLAVMHELIEIAAILIKAGANVNAIDKWDHTPLSDAKDSGNASMIRCLEEATQTSTNFANIFEAVEKGTVEDVRFFIEQKGVDVNIKNDKGRIPLHYAAARSKPEIMKYLIFKGAYVNAREEGGCKCTPLHLVVHNLGSSALEKVEALECLISNGADINAQEYDSFYVEGHTPLWWAIANTLREDTEFLVVRYLVSKGAIAHGIMSLSWLVEKYVNEAGAARKQNLTERPKERSKPSSDAGGCGCIIVIIAIVAFVIYYCSSGDTKTDKAASTLQEEPIAVPQNKPIKPIVIGKQTWMAENLNDASKGGKCYNNNPSNCEKYGRLYTWEEAKNACPDDWHLPSDAEWTTLTNFVGGGKVAGKKLRTRENGNGTDDYDFSAFSGGASLSDGNFDGIGNYGVWWSSTEYNSSNAYRRHIYHNNNNAYRTNYDKSFSFSVRCVKNIDTPVQ